MKNLLLSSLIVFLAGCGTLTGIDSVNYIWYDSGRPVIPHTIHVVQYDVVADACKNVQIPEGKLYMGCAVYSVPNNTCDIYVWKSNTVDYWIEHEIRHCKGEDHYIEGFEEAPKRFR